MWIKPSLFSFLVGVLVLSGRLSFAQNPPDGKEPLDARILEQNQIRPAFRCEPIVHRIEARRGQDI
ncbi:MAG: hypothetical protein KDA80_24530, partial [Planctomycetaceae bacterium]|nr:hypothetical protein [Planctomycetaceae bacterium]